MLAQIEPARNDFHVLANYLVHGEDRPIHPDRVAWVFGHNLATDDPFLAAEFMQATAQLSKRCAAPCLHFSVDWHPAEQPTPEVMQEIARRTLELAGLGEHQALVMGHGDKPHKHFHVMANRIHPATGKAYDLYRSHTRFDRIMRQLADEYGFLYVPPHSFHPEQTDQLPKAPNSNATYAARNGAPTDRMQWSAQHSREFGATISDTLDRASSWEDLEAAFADHGLTLEAKGQGLVVGDAESYIKFSKLGLQITANGLEKKFGRPFRPRLPEWFYDRIMEQRPQIRALIQEAADWHDLAETFAARGITLDRRGNSVFLVDAHGEIALYEMGTSLKQLEAHFDDPTIPALLRDKWSIERIADERERLRFVFQHATSWDQVRYRLHELGLSLAAKGKGMVIHDHDTETSLSSLGWSKTKLERQFANPNPVPDSPSPVPQARSPRPPNAPVALPVAKPRRAPPLIKVQAWAAARHVLTVDAVDVARAIGSRQDLQHAVRDAIRERKARLADKPLMDQLMEELKETLRTCTFLGNAPPPKRKAKRGRTASDHTPGR